MNHLSGIVIDSARGEVRRGEQCAALTPIEFAFFYRLWKARGNIVSEGSLRNAIYGLRPGCDVPRSRILVVVAHDVRAKVASLGVTVGNERNVGYRLSRAAAAQERAA